MNIAELLFRFKTHDFKSKIPFQNICNVYSFHRYRPIGTDSDANLLVQIGWCTNTPWKKKKCSVQMFTHKAIWTEI